MKEISWNLLLLPKDTQADIIKAFNSRYLDDVFNIDNSYFKGMVNLIYLPELRLNKVNVVWQNTSLTLVMVYKGFSFNNICSLKRLLYMFRERTY